MGAGWLRAGADDEHVLWPVTWQEEGKERAAHGQGLWGPLAQWVSMQPSPYSCGAGGCPGAERGTQCSCEDRQ